MKEHPIIFAGAMTRAILEGRKTQTRRVIRHPGNEYHYKKLLCDWGLSRDPHKWDGKERIRSWYGKKECKLGDWIWELQSEVDSSMTMPVIRLYGKPGDLLWVRETWWDRKDRLPAVRDLNAIHYDADGWIPSEDIAHIHYRRPSIDMPQWASRITLEITDVRVERVQEINEEDARSEGIIDGGCLNCGEHEPCGCNDPQPDARDAFIYLWNSINEKRGYGWIMNPWVWVISFKRRAT